MLPVLLAIGFAAAGCSSSTTAVAEPDATSETTESTETTEQAIEASDEGPIVVLTDPGAEPRVELRLRLAEEPGTFEMTQTQSLTQFIDGEEMTATGEITSVTDIAYEIEVSGENFKMTSNYLSMRAAEGTDPGVADAVARAGETLSSLETVAIIDSRGFVVSSETSGVDALPDDMLALMQDLIDNDQLTSPLPEEPVGVGATWEIRTSLVLNGAPIDQVTVFEVVSIDGDIVTLSASGGQTVAPGTIAMPGVPEGTDVEVLAWDVLVEGDSVVDLTRPMPTSTMGVTGRQSMRISDGSETIVLDQDVLQRLEIR